MRLPIVLSFVAVLSACSDKPAPAVTPADSPIPVAVAAPSTIAPAKPGKAELVQLMKAVYGERYRDTDGFAYVPLPDPDNRKQKLDYLVFAVAHKALPTGESVLVANAVGAGEDGSPDNAPSSYGMLNVYLLRQAGGKWAVTRRHETIASMSQYGNPGEVAWVDLAEGKPGLAMVNSARGQGYSFEYLALFDLTAERMHDLLEDSFIHSDNDDACMDDESPKCWNVSAKWELAAANTPGQFKDLILKFSGEKSTLAEKAEGEPAAARVVTAVDGSARYAYDGKGYRLVEGANPLRDE